MATGRLPCRLLGLQSSKHTLCRAASRHRKGLGSRVLFVPAPALLFHHLDASYCLFITCTQQVSVPFLEVNVRLQWRSELNFKALNTESTQPPRIMLPVGTPSGSSCVCVSGAEGKELRGERTNHCSTASLAPSHQTKYLFTNELEHGEHG